METAAEGAGDEAAEEGAPAADAGEALGPQDLGALATDADLRSAAAAALAAPRIADDQVTTGGDADASDGIEEEATTTAPLTQATGGAGDFRCEAEARAVDPALGPLTLSATATWQGRAAYVLGFRSDDADVDVFVLAVGDCALLAGPVTVER